MARNRGNGIDWMGLPMIAVVARRYVELFPHWFLYPSGAYLSAAMSYANRGDMTQALSELNRAVSQYHDMSLDECFDGWEDLGKLYYDQSKNPDATSVCQRAIDADPKAELAAFAELINGHAARKARQLAEAAEWYKRLLADHPNSAVAPDARYWLGYCLTWDHPEQAIPYLQEAIAKEKWEVRVANALWNLATCYSELEDFDRAHAAYDDLLSRKGGVYERLYPAAHTNIGFNYYRQRRYADARAELEPVISQWSDSDAASQARRILAAIGAAEAPAAGGGSQ